MPLIDSESIVTGGNGFAKVSSSKTDFSSSLGISHTPVDSDGSDRYSRLFLIDRRVLESFFKSGWHLLLIPVFSRHFSSPQLQIGSVRRGQAPLGTLDCGVEAESVVSPGGTAGLTPAEREKRVSLTLHLLILHHGQVQGRMCCDNRNRRTNVYLRGRKLKQTLDGFSKLLDLPLS